MRNIRVNVPPELLAFIEDALPNILPEIPSDDYSHEDDVLFGAVLGIMYTKGWHQRLSAGERGYFYRYIEKMLEDIDSLVVTYDNSLDR